MDDKEKQLIKYYHKKILDYAFDERDIYSFLMLLREHVDKNTPLREFGDYIGHRQKDRGNIKDYLRENKVKIDHVHKKTVPFGGFSIVSKEVYSLEHIERSFNTFFKKNNLELFSSELIEDIVLCIISLLHNIKILHKNKHIGDLHMAISKATISLQGSVKISSTNANAAFPVLIIKNKYMDITSVDEHDTPRFLTVVLEVINRNNKLNIDIADKELLEQLLKKTNINEIAP